MLLRSCSGILDISRNLLKRAVNRMNNFNVVGMAQSVEGAFVGPLDDFFIKQISAANVALDAGLTDDEIKFSASADRKLFFAGVNKGLGMIGTK